MAGLRRFAWRWAASVFDSGPYGRWLLLMEDSVLSVLWRMRCNNNEQQRRRERDMIVGIVIREGSITCSVLVSFSPC